MPPSLLLPLFNLLCYGLFKPLPQGLPLSHGGNTGLMDCFRVYPYAGVWLTPTDFHSLTVKPVIPIVNGYELSEGADWISVRICSGTHVLYAGDRPCVRWWRVIAGALSPLADY